MPTAASQPSAPAALLARRSAPDSGRQTSVGTTIPSRGLSDSDVCPFDSVGSRHRAGCLPPSARPPRSESSSPLRILVYPHDLTIGGSQINAIDLAAGVQMAGHD